MGLEELRRKMLVLAAEFGAALPGRVAELQALVEAARADNGAADRLDAARVQAHRMKGSAGTFGFGTTSTAAGRVEQLLNGLKAQAPVSVEHPSWAELAALCDELGRLASEAAGGTE